MRSIFSVEVSMIFGGKVELKQQFIHLVSFANDVLDSIELLII
jgi:DNA topoisomerase VI subunit B